MTDLQNPRSWNDGELDEAWRLLELHLPEGNATQVVRAEAARRAEIRIARREYGVGHGAAWYEPRTIDGDPCINWAVIGTSVPCSHSEAAHDEDGCGVDQCGCEQYRIDGATE